MSLGTLISRILGFIRDILIANFFGTSGILEAFLVSFRLPNIFRSIFAEGFSESAVTPVLSEYHGDKEKIFKTGNNLISISTVVLLLSVLTGAVFSRFLVMVIAPGFIAESFKFSLAVSFTRITFIYLFLIGLSVNLTSLLYALKKFFVPAVNPAFLNISFIVGILLLGRFFKNSVLIASVVAAGFLQVLFPYLALKQEGFSLEFNFFKSLKDPTIIRMFKLFIPRIWSSIVYHLSVLIDTAFSSLSFIVGEGALASVYYANRLIQFPFALIALSVSRVAIVDLSSYHRQGRMDEFKRLLVFSFQNIIFFIIPLSVVFMFISRDIIDVIFARGKFTAHSLSLTATVLFFYSFGLFFFCGVKLLVNSFYSLKDTALPAKTASLSLIANIILSASLMFPLKIGGVALGSSLAAMLNYFLLKRSLAKRIGRIDWEDTPRHLLKVFLLSIAMGIFTLLAMRLLAFNKYLKMLIALSGAFLILSGGGYLLGLKQIHYLTAWIFGKK